MSDARDIIKIKPFRAKPYDKKLARFCLRLSGMLFFTQSVSMCFVINTRIYNLPHKMYNVLRFLSAFKWFLIAHYLLFLHGIGLYLEHKLIIHEEHW